MNGGSVVEFISSERIASKFSQMGLRHIHLHVGIFTDLCNTMDILSRSPLFCLVLCVSFLISITTVTIAVSVSQCHYHYRW